jgi:hypothetical protein
LQASKVEWLEALAMALIERRPSILERISHSLVFRLICPSRPSGMTNSGTRSIEGTFFCSTRHSSSRRAASIKRLVFVFVMVFAATEAPVSKKNSPLLQMASW